MKITWSDNRNRGMIDTTSITEKPTLSFSYEWIYVDDTRAEYTPKERANYPELVDIPEATMASEYVNRPLSDSQLAEVTAFYNVFPREPLSYPIYDEATQKLVENGTVVVGGLTYKNYDVIALTQIELDAKFKASVPQEIRMAQCRAQLIIDGLDDDVEALINAITDPTQQKLYRAFWEYETIVKKDNVMIVEMAVPLGIDLDTFVINASKL